MPTPTNIATRRRTQTRPDFVALDAVIKGSVVTPDAPDWDEARRAWNLIVDQRPAAVALPESAEDIVAIVDFARDNEFRVAPQGTGHNAHPLEERLAETIL